MKVTPPPERESAARKNKGILTLFRKTHAISHAMLLKAQKVRVTKMVAHLVLAFPHHPTVSEKKAAKSECSHIRYRFIALLRRGCTGGTVLLWLFRLLFRRFKVYCLTPALSPLPPSAVQIR